MEISICKNQRIKMKIKALSFSRRKFEKAFILANYPKPERKKQKPEQMYLAKIRRNLISKRISVRHLEMMKI